MAQTSTPVISMQQSVAKGTLCRGIWFRRGAGELIPVEMLDNARRDRPRYNAGEIFGAGQPYASDTAEFAQQFLHGSRTDAWNFVELGFQGSARAALAVKTHGKTVCFITDLLNQVQQGRMFFEANRFVLLAENEKDFFLLGDGGHGLIDDFQLFQGLRSGVQLSQPAVDQNQAGHFLLFALHPAIAAFYCLAHTCEIVIAPFAANDEFAVIGFAHAPVFPDDHRGNRIGSLEMGNIEALDALRWSGKIQRGLERLGNGFGIGLQDAESLLERMARIFLHQIQERMLRTALRYRDLHAAIGQVQRFGALRKDVFEQLAILEIAHDVNGSRQIGGIEIKLLEHRGKKFVGIEFLEVFPIEITAIDYAAGANVEKIHGYLGRLGVPGEHVGVVAGSSGNFLPLFNLFQGMQEVAVTCGLLVTLVLRCLHHALTEAGQQVVTAAFQKGTRVARRLRVFFVRYEAGDARTPATVNVILQAGARMLPREVHRAGRNPEVFVNEMNDAVGEAVREAGPETDRAILAQAARHVNSRIFFKRREADVRIGLVIPQQDVEFRLILFD